MEAIYGAVIVMVIVGGIGGTGYLFGSPDIGGPDINDSYNNSTDIGDRKSSSNGTTEGDITVVDGKLEAGSSVTVRVTLDGRMVEGASVEMEGIPKGKTGSAGTVSFLVPYADEISVEASKDEFEISEQFEISSRDQNSDESEGSDDDSTGADEGNEEEEQESNGTEEGIGDGTESLTEASITKVSPSSLNVTSSEFEAEFRLNATNASYLIRLEDEKVAEGEVDGSKVVSNTFNLSEPGFKTLEIYLMGDGGVLTEKNYTVNYSEYADSEPSDLVADLEAPSSIMAGSSITLDASNSSGNILNYSWKFGDGSEVVTSSPEVQHVYQDSGDYQIELTVKGSNGRKDNISVSIEVISQEVPSIDFISPLEGFETDKSTLEYEFNVSNADEGAEYSIMVDGTERTTGSLTEGSNNVEASVDIPERLFNTSIVVNQAGKAFRSENRTINASITSSGPEFSLNSPEDGKLIEILETETSVYVTYEVGDRDWATSATLSLMNETSTLVERPVSPTEGVHTEVIRELTEGNYDVLVSLSDGSGREKSESHSLEISEIEADNSVSLSDPNGTEADPDRLSNYNVTFNMSVSFNSSINLNASVKPVEKLERTFMTCSDGEKVEKTITYNEGETIYSYQASMEGESISKFSFQRKHYIKGLYKWKAQLKGEDGSKISKTRFGYYNVTTQPDLGVEGSCSGPSQ